LRRPARVILVEPQCGQLSGEENGEVFGAGRLRGGSTTESLARSFMPSSPHSTALIARPRFKLGFVDAEAVFDLLGAQSVKCLWQEEIDSCESPAWNERPNPKDHAKPAKNAYRNTPIHHSRTTSHCGAENFPCSKMTAPS